MTCGTDQTGYVNLEGRSAVRKSVRQKFFEDFGGLMQAEPAALEGLFECLYERETNNIEIYRRPVSTWIFYEGNCRLFGAMMTSVTRTRIRVSLPNSGAKQMSFSCSDVRRLRGIGKNGR